MKRQNESESEKAKIQDLMLIFREFMESHYPPRVRPALRPVHAKTLGLVEADFRIESDLPVKARHGIFGAADPRRALRALIRFSNAASTKTADSKSGIRGMAVKLPNVHDGRDQDFVLINSPVFFVPVVDDLIDFARATMRSEDAMSYVRYILRGFVGGSNPLSRIWNLVRMVRKSSSTPNPLTSSYWSTVPFRLGGDIVKYTARPQQSGGPAENDSSPDFLRKAMVKHLNNAGAQFDFMVQFQTDSVRMPVDNPTVEWDERESPPVKVATIHIPKQHFDLPARMDQAEALDFAPWHALPGHEPLGQINRFRRAIYEAMEELRHNMN